MVPCRKASPGICQTGWAHVQLDPACFILTLLLVRRSHSLCLRFLVPTPSARRVVDLQTRGRLIPLTCSFPFPYCAELPHSIRRTWVSNYVQRRGRPFKAPQGLPTENNAKQAHHIRHAQQACAQLSTWVQPS